jgi:hypothetical protein
MTLELRTIQMGMMIAVALSFVLGGVAETGVGSGDELLLLPSNS